MLPRPPLDLTRDAEAVAGLPEHGAQSSATISKILQILKSFRGQRPSTMSLKNSRLCEDVFEHGVHLLGRGFHHVWASNYVAKSRADALQVKGLELLGHILDFATFRIKCCRQHLMREICTSGSTRGGVVGLRPRCPSYSTGSYLVGTKLHRLALPTKPKIEGTFQTESAW